MCWFRYWSRFRRSLGLIGADPALEVGDAGVNFHIHALPGLSNLDPNSGFTMQALGRVAAVSWLRGVVPWWNSYSGVGMPLAGEYQPAAFSPLTLLLALPNGVALATSGITRPPLARAATRCCDSSGLDGSPR